MDITFLYVILSIIAILLWLFFAFKYFAKTTWIILLLLIGWGLVWDYQASKLPVYDLSVVPDWYFDQERNIVPRDEDQYTKLLDFINQYSESAWYITGYSDLRSEYGIILWNTGSQLNSFFKNKSIQVLSFEKELLEKTDIEQLESIVFTWKRWDLDPSIDIELQITDAWNWSQNLVRNLTMIWWTYCYMYSLQNSGVEKILLEQKCLSYFDQASTITQKQFDRKWSLISKLVTMVNANIVLNAANNLNLSKMPTSFKATIKENLNFIQRVTEQEFNKNYKVDDYNTIYVSSIDDILQEDIERLDHSRIFDDFEGLTFIPLLTNNVGKKTIADAKYRAIELWQYFFMLEDADQPIQELARSNARHENSISRFLLATLGIDDWKFISYSLSSRSINHLVPRLTWVERTFKELIDKYLKYIK